jgi:hypothetical protein
MNDEILVERVTRAIYEALYDRPVSLLDCEKAARAALAVVPISNRLVEERTSAPKGELAE